MSTLYMGIIAPSVVLVPLGIGLYTYRNHTSPERMALYYLWLSVTFNIIAKVTAGMKINNMPYLHLYTVLEFVLLCLLFRTMFTGLRLKQALTCLAVGFTLVVSIYTLQSNTLYTYNVWPRFVASILVLSLCVLYLVTDLVKTEGKGSVFSLFAVTGLLLYFSGSSALFGFSDSITGNRRLNTIIWNIHATLFALMYIFFALGYLKGGKRQ